MERRGRDASGVKVKSRATLFNAALHQDSSGGTFFESCSVDLVIGFRPSAGRRDLTDVLENPRAPTAPSSFSAVIHTVLVRGEKGSSYHETLQASPVRNPPKRAPGAQA